MQCGFRAHALTMHPEKAPRQCEFRGEFVAGDSSM
jgi:hypothetical protein